MTKNILKNFIKVLVVLAIFFFLGLTLYKSWTNLHAYTLKFNYFLLILSALFLVIYCISTAFGWAYILNKFFARISYKKAIRIRLISDIARYVPGNIWFLFGRVYFGKKEGIPKEKIFFSSVIEVVINLLAAMILSYFLVIFIAGKFKILLFLLPILIILSLIFLYPPVFSFFINLGLKILKKPRMELKIKYQELLLLLFMYIIFWAVQGFAFYLLAASIYQISLTKAIFFSSTFILGWTLGFLSFFTPSGLGVREAVLSFLLALYLPTPIAILIALVSRLWFTIIEVIVALIAYRFMK